MRRLACVSLARAGVLPASARDAAMITLRPLLASLVLLTGLFAAPAPARAETFNTCAGFIDTVPATITTQGTWCLRHDLTTAITSGNAITIATNNVTIDCNDFKLGGLQAGNSSQANGIVASGHLNSTVRHCNVRGYYYGIYADGSGNLVEDNRLDQNLYIAIRILGENNRVRRNAVFDTGGSPANPFTYGIVASADVIENTVSGVFAIGADTSPTGILLSGAGMVASGNHVRGLAVSGTGSAAGINAYNIGIRVEGNHVSAATTTNGFGIRGNGATDTFCGGNTIAKFSTPIGTCQDTGGNASN